MSSPEDVVRSALMQPIPCPTCERVVRCRCMPDRVAKLNWRVTLIVEALRAQGMLPPETPVEQPSIEDVARWLADQSRHPRYVGIPDGWRKLLESDADVMVAHRAAVDTHRGDTELERAFSRARDDLLREVAARRAAGHGG